MRDEHDGIFLTRPREIGRGTRLAVKDLFDTAGLATTYGSAIFAGHVPARTASAVPCLEAAGYTNVGKTNLHEFAYGVTQNPHFGTVPNPLAGGRLAGGSSGGSAAALAAGHANRYGDDVRTKLERCFAVTEEQYEAALRRRAAYCERLDAAAERFDVLLTPTLAFVAPRTTVRELHVRDAMIRFTYPFNLAGWPALALPCGPAEDGLPASVQVVGRPGEVRLVLAVGDLLERLLSP